MSDTHIKFTMLLVTAALAWLFGTTMGMVTEKYLAYRSHPEFNEKRNNPA